MTKRSDSTVRPADGTTTTHCVCGQPFTPARKNQVCCSRQCRQKKYEKTAKARARRARYWKEGNASVVQRRYAEKHPSSWEPNITVLTLNKRAYRERTYRYGHIACHLWDTVGDDNLTLEQVFGDGPEQVPWKNAYTLLKRLDNRYVWRADFRKTKFYQKLVAYLSGGTGCAA